MYLNFQIIFVWRSNRSGSRAGCRTSDISGKSYLYHQYAVAGTWIYIPWKRIWSQNCLRQCTDIGWVKLCGAGVSDGCASDRTAGIRAYLCDRTAGISAAILFNIGASGGGTDIVAMILKKYTKLNIGAALF